MSVRTTSNTSFKTESYNSYTYINIISIILNPSHGGDWGSFENYHGSSKETVDLS